MSHLKTNYQKELCTVSVVEQYNRDVVRNRFENQEQLKNNKKIKFSLGTILGYHWDSNSRDSIRQSKPSDTGKSFTETDEIIGHVYKDNIFYYINNIFIALDIVTKKTQHIYEDTKVDGEIQLIKYFPLGKQSLFLAVKRKGDSLYFSLLFIEKFLSDLRMGIEHRAKILKLGQEKREKIVDVQYRAQKQYLFMLLEQNSQSFESEEHLQIVQINKRSLKTILPQQKIKKTKNYPKIVNQRSKDVSPNFNQDKANPKATNLIILSDHREFYVYGDSFFRHYSISYHQKTMHQSNYRGIQRALKGLTILTVYVIDGQKFQKFKHFLTENQPKQTVVIFTQQQAFFVYRHQVVSRMLIPIESPYTIASIQNQATELAIQKSLNQIYKTKFRMETISDDLEDDEYDDRICVEGPIKKKNIDICSISIKFWTEKSTTIQERENNESEQERIGWFCAVTSEKKVFIYSILSSMEVRIQSMINTPENYFDDGMFKKFISTCDDGSILLMHDWKGDMLIADTRQENVEVRYLYGEGAPHRRKIVSISSPELNQVISSVDNEGYIKIWKVLDKYKNLILDFRPKNKPLNAIMHPSGLLVAANFGHEIKVYGIVSDAFEQLAAIKTNDFCSTISFCKINQFLISNQKSFIKLYEPFTLQCNHRIQPNDLKLEIKNFKISENGQFIVYQCSNNEVFRFALSNFATKNYRQNDNFHGFKDFSQSKSQLCHKQSTLYSCFHFDFGKSKDYELHQKEKELDMRKCEKQSGTLSKDRSIYKKNMSKEKANIFIGFTETKYMVIYGDYASRLIAQFPIADFFVTDLYLEDSLLFLGTSKGSIIAYNWPIYEEFLEIQVYSNFGDDEKKGRIKAPQYQEFLVWEDKAAITAIHKVSQQTKIIVGNKNGSLAFVNYQISKHNQEKCSTSHNLSYKGQMNPSKSAQQKHQRKKLEETMSSLKYIKLSEQERINKLIEKTQNDIIKLQYEINRQKKQKLHQFEREKQEKEENYERKAQLEQEQFTQYENDQIREIRKLRSEYERRKNKAGKDYESLEEQCLKKVSYEEGRLAKIKEEQVAQKNKYQKMIRQMASEHKKDIQLLKKQYWTKIKSLNQEFQIFIAKELPTQQHQTITPIQFQNQEEMIIPGQIQELMMRVQQLTNQLNHHQQKISILQEQNIKFNTEDFDLQIQFEQTLDRYNKGRFQNLTLHSEVLKMQNQLLERKQILDKKDSVISVVRYEKEVNETFKAFAKGGINGVEKAKQSAYFEYVQKQDELKALFHELQSQIRTGEQQKVRLNSNKMMSKILEKEAEDKKNIIRGFRQKLMNLKKILLLEGLSDSAQQKKIYQEQQKLLIAIKWLQKRFKMTCINEKKLINLKQEGVQQIIKQNKHLLQECNQLREQGIEYENEINHLSEKLAQANKIIDLQRKMKHQKGDLTKQTMKLEQIRQIFSKQLNVLSYEDADLQIRL